MISYITNDFIKLFSYLPNNIKELARKSYKLWKTDPYHPSLHFKQIHSSEQIWSVRIGLKWRVLGLLSENSIYWFWIGSHNDYDKLITQF